MLERLRLGVLVTHPIQYYAALFRELAQTPGVDLTVYFAHRPTAEQQGQDFGVAFQWDVDLTGGYRHVWLDNTATKPGVGHFNGCDTPGIADAIRHEAFDAFLLMGWHSKSYWQAIHACWSMGVPMLVRGDSQLEDDRPAKRFAKRSLYPLFMRRFAACLSVGTRSDAYFRYYGARSVVRVPHFVDNGFFQRAAAAADREALRRRFGFDSRSMVVCFAGKLVDKKRPLDVIEAVGRLGRNGVSLLVAGDGELRGACESRARELGVDAHFAGFLNQSRITDAYAAADALVLPSGRCETWGLVVNEAMASGRPAIVSSSVGCGPDLIVEGSTGFTFRTGDVAELAERIGRLAERPPLCDEMGFAARRHISDFSVEAATSGVLEAAASVRLQVAA